MSDDVWVDTDSGAMPGHLWLPSSGAASAPGILLLQEIFGVSRYIRSRAADLAEAGYVVLAPELYWRLDQQTVDESAADALEQAMGLVGKLDWEQTVADCAAALATLRERPDVEGRVGVLGFCFGGGLAFNLSAVAEPDVLVEYYGSAVPGLVELAPQITCPALHHYGLADDYIPPGEVAKIEAAVAAAPNTRFETYPGANHAFDNPDFFLHDPEASRLAWQRTQTFLAEHLPVTS
jgi:carboxymethylenebutenolidase